MLTLYSYWRSSSAYRVRIALNLKGLDYVIQPVNLAPAHSEQRTAAYRAVSPDALVPVLEHDGQRLSQSLAICEYLDQTFRERPLLPDNPVAQATVRSFCLAIACEIQPLNNLRVLNYLGEVLAASDLDRQDWYRHWISAGFTALERRLAAHPGPRFAFGERPGLAECLLIPQLYNARRYECPLDPYPGLRRIESACAELPEFIRAHPDSQPDKPETLP